MAASGLGRFAWPLSCTMVSPLATTATENAPFGVDRDFLRAEDGRILISGDQIRGLFRHFVELVRDREVAAGIAEDACLLSEARIEAFFGREGLALHANASAGGAASAGSRGRLVIRDLVLAEHQSQDRSDFDRTRIRIDRQRGSVKTGSYLVRRQEHPTGEVLAFAGREPLLRDVGSFSDCVILYGTVEDALVFETAFDLFSQLVPGLGAMKSAGLGAFDCQLTLGGRRMDGLVHAHGASSPAAVVTSLALVVSDPFLCEPTIASGNLQEASETISGSVLKASVAEYGALLLGPKFQADYGDLLSRMTFRLAQPIERYSEDLTDGRAMRLRIAPMSLIVGVDDQDRRSRIDYFEAGTEWSRLVFPCNFKEEDSQDFERYYLKEPVPRVTRTRTAIEVGAWHAEEERLFNYRMIDPTRHAWYLDILLPADATDEDRRKASVLIGLLSSGCVQIGKTRADLKAFVLSSAEPAVATPKTINGQTVWRMTLQTPAHLLTVDLVEDLRSSTLSLRDAYRIVLSDCLSAVAGELEIEDDVESAIDWDQLDFLAQHRLFGGDRAYRYRKAAGGEQGYYPFLLTEAGSVFLLPQKADLEAVLHGQLQAVFDELALRGLPTTERDWRKDPFVRENGFGEVLIDWTDADIAAALG